MRPTNPQPPLLFTAGRRNPAYFVCRRISAAEFQRFLRRGSTGYGNSEPEEAEAKPPHGDAKSTPNTGAVQQLTHGDEPRTRSSPPGQDTSQPANPRVSESLENRDARCSTWAARGECARNHVYMAETCAKACAQVEESSVDREPHCALWSSMGECERNPEFMALRCARSCAANTGDA